MTHSISNNKCSITATNECSSDTVYSVGSISFIMKAIAAVTGGVLGHSDDEYNQSHTVNLCAYRIDETPVTQDLWQAVMGYNPSYFDNTGIKISGYDKSAQIDTAIESGENQLKRPVENISLYECIAFCNKLSLKLGLEPCYTVITDGTPIDFQTLSFDEIPVIDRGSEQSAAAWDNAILDMSKNGFRVPTEAEWEWAAKGGMNNKWVDTDIETELTNYAWYDENSGRKTHEVKKKLPNGYGLYDMSGNVWEWCWDCYDDNIKWLRTIRGGSSFSDSFIVRRTFRFFAIPDDKVPINLFSNFDDSCGLRLVCR